jgi:U4/U6 small nuclear ribonucleoprotein PRP4
LQAADRRDRLIYVLSQINAARGDDVMQVDEDESSDESEEEVWQRFLFYFSFSEQTLL